MDREISQTTGVVVRTAKGDAVPRRSTSKTSPFGVRRPSDGKNRNLFKLEFLFSAFAVLALVYLGSLGPKLDPWLETAKAQLESQVLTCSTCSPMQAYDRVDQRFALTPDSAIAIRAKSGSAFESEVVEPNSVIPDESLSDIATVRVEKQTETLPPAIGAAHLAKSPASEVAGRATGSSLQSPHVQRRAKPSAMSVPERLSSERYHQVPRGTEKMFDQNWQSKAFLYE